MFQEAKYNKGRISNQQYQDGQISNQQYQKGRQIKTSQTRNKLCIRMFTHLIGDKEGEIIT